MTRILKQLGLATFVLATVSSAAEAHTGVGAVHGFGAGFMHPLTGMDHIAAMVAVGILAVRVGGKAIWMVPLAFLSMMAAAAVATSFGLAIPFAEAGIMASVLVLGGAALKQMNISVLAAAGIAGFFAVFHGVSHGLEMPAGSTVSGYAAGFLAATTALHLVGIAVALATASVFRRRYSGIVN